MAIFEERTLMGSGHPENLEAARRDEIALGVHGQRARARVAGVPAGVWTTEEARAAQSDIQEAAVRLVERTLGEVRSIG